jgi:hypothetical protein
LIVVFAVNITAIAVAIAVAVAAVVVLSLLQPVVRLVCRTTSMRWRWGARGEKKHKNIQNNFRSGARESVPNKF